MTTFDHMQYVETAAMDWMKGVGPVAYKQTWEELTKNWNMIESRAAASGYDIFVEDTAMRHAMMQFRHDLLHIEAHVREDITGPGVEYKLHVTVICERDVEELRLKDASYGSSWKKRGGVGAFMMMARKWDRLPQQIAPYANNLMRAMHADEYRDNRSDGIWDTVGDLRRYLILIEAELLAREATR